MNVSSIKDLATATLSRTGFLLKKYSPEIMLGAGLVGTVASAIVACKATTKAAEIQARSHADFAAIEDVKERRLNVPDENGVVEYTEEKYKHDILLVTVQTGMAYVKLYAPAATLMAASVGLILASHGIMTNRQAAALAAYKVLDASYRKYRDRVIEDVGSDKDLEYVLGKTEAEVVTVTDKIINADGTETEIESTQIVQRGKEYENPYVKWFDEHSPRWQRARNLNLYFLQTQERFANQRLQSVGFVFLNDVLADLGIPQTDVGQLTGWKKGNGDDVVDFGLRNPANDNPDPLGNNPNPPFLLNFNVDGPIWNLI